MIDLAGVVGDRPLARFHYESLATRVCQFLLFFVQRTQLHLCSPDILTSSLAAALIASLAATLIAGAAHP